MSESYTQPDPFFESQERRTPPAPSEQGRLPSRRPPDYPVDQIVRESEMGGMYAENRYTAYQDEAGQYVERRQQVYRDKNQQRAYLRYWFDSVLYGLLSALEIILLLRFIFRLLGANTDNGFISFLYGFTNPLVRPFQGIFTDPSLGKQAVLEFSTLIAMLIYALITWAVVSVINFILRPRPIDSENIVSTRRRF